MSTLPANRLTEEYLQYAPTQAFNGSENDSDWVPDTPTPDNLEELAHIIRTMTYGELTTLAEEAGISAPHLHGWSMK